MKKKLDDLTKCKLTYSGELIVFGLVFIVVGILFLVGTISVADWKKWVFTIISLPGSIWAIVDFVWVLKSEKRRKKNCLLDKALLLPNSFALIGMDIFAIINLAKDPNFVNVGSVNFFQYAIGSALLYVSIVEVFQGVYHWFNIHPIIYEMLEDEKKKEEEEKAKADICESKEETSSIVENKSEEIQDKKED